MAVVEINVVEHEGADLGDPDGVHCGKRKDGPCGWRGDGGNSVVDVFGHQWSRNAVLVTSGLDAAGRAAEDQAVALGPGERPPQRNELVSAVMAVARLEVSESVFAGCFPKTGAYWFDQPTSAGWTRLR
ncbi:hypothetical protein [Streptomyces inhibens]|uniref:hypothetical protein n=1 Tax=Streptomyces inhibens TaxID=2293571 RepID=UPI001EE71A24|nr:hypothetical protein [Streptomyces inhibens]UKY54546.1 hypothetical protein KI385_40905 [Streptomyces inhibens]